MVVLDPITGLPTGDDVRKTAVDVLKKTQKHVLASATAFLGDDFWASALRGVLTTLDVLAGSAKPQKTFRTPEQAVDWALAELGEPPCFYRSALLDALASMAKP